MKNNGNKLAVSLKKLQKFQNENVLTVVKTADLGRIHLDRLVKNGFLQEVIKGWYILARPDENRGDTTNWYSAYWAFIAKYANYRFGKNWCLSAEQSLIFHSGDKTVPKQIIIRISKGSNNVLNLLHKTSILYFRASIAKPLFYDGQFGLHLYSLPEALIECSPDFFKTDPITTRTCLSLISDVSDILKILIERGQTKKAGRLAGALRNLGYRSKADEIVATMKRMNYDVREADPFCEHTTAVPYTHPISPYAARLALMWDKMRKTVIKNFPKPQSKNTNISQCMKEIDEQYKFDAYNSLSIEGYQITDDLIAKVKSGRWNPQKNPSDAQQVNAMAARGYWQAFNAVKKSINKILLGKNAGKIAANEHKIWYQELFAPSVAAGLLKPADLIGYRMHQVYIRASIHTPLNPQAVKDAMP
ncbi:MAG: cell filamentation protein Fic, partial [Elusimicrobiota bacterium]|nr:cell filamentation protein Fic [Elusimicrobiota bacterium]